MLFILFFNLFIETIPAENEDMRSFLKEAEGWHNHNIIILGSGHGVPCGPDYISIRKRSCSFFAKKRETTFVVYNANFFIGRL